MKVRVRFFGGPREALGRNEIEQQLPAGSTAGDLVNLLGEEYPVLGPYCRVIKVAVNRKYESLESQLHEGDEVALLPPVGGG